LRRRLVLDQVEELGRARTRSPDALRPAAAGGAGLQAGAGPHRL